MFEERLEAHLNNSVWKLKMSGVNTVIQRPSQFCEIYLQDLHQVLTVNVRNKSPCFQHKEGKRNHFEICLSILFLTRPVLGETYVGEGKYLTPVNPVYLSKAGGRRATHLKNLQSCLRKDSDLVIQLQNAFPLHTP